jgi:hypothetical protein
MLRAVSRAARVKMTASGTPNLNYCVILYYVSNLQSPAGHIAPSGGPRVGHPCCSRCFDMSDIWFNSPFVHRRTSLRIGCQLRLQYVTSCSEVTSSPLRVQYQVSLVSFPPCAAPSCIQHSGTSPRYWAVVIPEISMARKFWQKLPCVKRGCLSLTPQHATLEFWNFFVIKSFNDDSKSIATGALTYWGVGKCGDGLCETQGVYFALNVTL